jgi:hypothetical protein
MRYEDASFARSFGSCSSILTTHSAQVEWWGVRVGITVGQTRGTGRNQHWGRHERTKRDSSHVTVVARRRAWHVENRKTVEAVVPTRIRESRFGCPHVEVQLQKSVGGVWSRISSAYALQKERSGSSERGPSTSESRRVKPSAGTSGETNVVSRPHRCKTGEDRRKAQGGERSSSSGRNIAKSGAVVAGPGL